MRNVFRRGYGIAPRDGRLRARSSARRLQRDRAGPLHRPVGRRCRAHRQGENSLAEEDGVNPMSINVNTYRGVVQLSGFVESEEAKRRAENAANDVEDVRSVKNDLRVAPRSSSGATKAR
jgi:hypothetical protein